MGEELEKVTVLAVTDQDETLRELRALFAHTRWQLAAATRCEDAVERLKTGRYPVVVCEQKLDDGCWRNILAALPAGANPPKLLVTSSKADERLWTEVLTAGVYDLLPRPFDRSEVIRIIGLAWRDWGHQRAMRAAAGAPTSDTGLRS